MLIFIVFFVSVNILMVKTENDVVRVNIKEGSCTVEQDGRIGTKFILKVRSAFFVISSTWTHKDKQTAMEDLENSEITVIYNKKKQTPQSKSTVTYTYIYLHTRKVNESLLGNWTFSFQYLKDYDPWSLVHGNVSKICSCNASFMFKGQSSDGNEMESSDNSRSNSGVEGFVKLENWGIIVLSLFALLLVVQSSYIIYGKVKGCRANKTNSEDPISPKSPKGKRAKRKRNMSNRPPCPLPPDEVIETPPQSPTSPGSVHTHLVPTEPPMPVGNHYDSPSNSARLVSKPSFRHQGLNTSEEGITSPVFGRRQPGQLVPTKSYRNKALDISVEELRTPGFPRRHTDGPLVPKQSYRNKALDTSIEELRTPRFPPRHMDGPLVPTKSYRNKALNTPVEERRAPGFPRNHMDGPLVPKQSYRNKALDTSVEELRTPRFPPRHMDGHIVPKQTYRNSVCISDDSDEEHKAPGFARRQIEAKFAQLSAKGIAPSKSFKLPRPLPCSPLSPTLERAAFNPAHRQEPVPPLHPKKLPKFPPPAPFRKQDHSRMSGDEWQHEQLQPSSKYFQNNCNNCNKLIK